MKEIKLTTLADGHVESLESDLVELHKIDDKGKAWCLQIHTTDGPLHIHLSSKKRISAVHMTQGEEEADEFAEAAAELYAMPEMNKALARLREDAIAEVAALTGKSIEEIRAEFDERDKKVKKLFAGFKAAMRSASGS